MMKRLMMTLAAFSLVQGAVAITATKEYVDRKVAAAVPGNYMTVSNKAMTAVQKETDPTIKAWAKAAAKPSYTASEVGAVPKGRKVNGKALSADITLGAGDVGAYTKSETDGKISSANTAQLKSAAFSNAVLTVGLNISQEQATVLNEIAKAYGGFPIGGTATTVGGLLAALAAGVAWLKKKTKTIEDTVGEANDLLEEVK